MQCCFGKEQDIHEPCLCNWKSICRVCTSLHGECVSMLFSSVTVIFEDSSVWYIVSCGLEWMSILDDDRVCLRLGKPCS